MSFHLVVCELEASNKPNKANETAAVGVKFFSIGVVLLSFCGLVGLAPAPRSAKREDKHNNNTNSFLLYLPRLSFSSANFTELDKLRIEEDYWNGVKTNKSEMEED